ncbi:unnamed protein product [Clavelina lepadiformis]|uniref:Uncharacterized protein n=1 Tax=Clavelina lepadiformis TaxID=159417 RepID=A0ABP0FVB4_CLALP
MLRLELSKNNRHCSGSYEEIPSCSRRPATLVSPEECLDSVSVHLYSISITSSLSDSVSSSSENVKPLNTGGGNLSECGTGRIADGMPG